MEKRSWRAGPNQLFVQQYIPKEKSFPYPILFIHGSFTGYSIWDSNAMILAEAGFECFAFSLRGHKPNEKINLAEVAMGNYREDVAAVIDNLHLNNPVLIACGMGGLLALMYAKTAVVKAIIAIGPSPTLETEKPWADEEIAKIPLMYTAAQANIFPDSPELSQALPDVPRDAIAEMLEHYEEESGLARRQRKMGISIPRHSISCPMLFIASEYGNSIGFGIPAQLTQGMAQYYGADFFFAKNTSHLGIHAGIHAKETMQTMAQWLREKVFS